MALSQIIVHKLQRQDPNNGAQLQLRDDCWPQNGRIEECFRELKQTILKRFSKEYGRFSDDYAAHPLSPWLKEYLSEKMSFARWSQKVMEHMAVTLDKTEELMEGFFFFAHEQLEAADFLHVLFVQHNTGHYIDGTLNMEESWYLDTKNVCLAAKINLTDWQSDDPQRATNAVTLSRWRGEKELSEVFIDAIGFTDKVDINADTEVFLNVVSDFTKDLPDDVAHYTKRQVVDYCLEQDKIGKPVVMQELSEQLSNPPETPHTPLQSTNEQGETVEYKRPQLAAFVETHHPMIKPEIIPDKAQLRNFVRISGRDNTLSMSFSSRCLGDTIVYNAASDSLTINAIPPAIKARINKHLLKASDSSDDS